MIVTKYIMAQTEDNISYCLPLPDHSESRLVEALPSLIHGFQG